MPLFRRLAASPRTTGLSPRLFSFAAYGNQSGTHCEKSSYNTSCLSAGRITGIRYPKWSSPSLFTVGTSLIILTKVFFFSCGVGSRNIKLTTYFIIPPTLTKCGVYLHFPYTFHDTGLVLILRIPQESALARQDVCVLLPPCEGEVRSEVYIECRVDP